MEGKGMVVVAHCQRWSRASLHCHSALIGSALRNTAGTLTSLARTLLTLDPRRTSQKPSDDLYKNFKANFPELGGANGTATTSAPDQTQTQPPTSLAAAHDVPPNPR